MSRARRWLREHWRLLILAGVLAGVASCEGDQSTSFGRELRVRRSIEAGYSKPVGALVLQRSFGSGRGALSFGRIGRAAISSSGVIAITDADSCEIVFIDERTGALLSRIGRCGRIPESFQSITSLQFRGDTLVAFDGRSQSVALVSTLGRDISHFILPQFRGDGAYAHEGVCSR